jgi:hypothetical protein
MDEQKRFRTNSGKNELTFLKINLTIYLFANI